MQSLSFILPMTGDFVENKKITFKEVYNEFIEKEAPATRAYATVVRYLNRLPCEGIECEYLVKPLEKDYTDVVKSLKKHRASSIPNSLLSLHPFITIPTLNFIPQKELEKQQYFESFSHFMLVNCLSNQKCA